MPYRLNTHRLWFIVAVFSVAFIIAHAAGSDPEPPVDQGGSEFFASRPHL